MRQFHDVGMQELCMFSLDWFGQEIQIHLVSGVTLDLEVSFLNLVLHEEALDVEVPGALVAAPASILMQLDGALVVLQHSVGRFMTWCFCKQASLQQDSCIVIDGNQFSFGGTSGVDLLLT